MLRNIDYSKITQNRPIGVINGEGGSISIKVFSSTSESSYLFYFILFFFRNV